MPTWLIWIVDVVLAAGMTARLTHAVTVEDIGGRLLRDPAERWVLRATDLRLAKRRWWADALSCPWCVSTWIGLLSIVALALATAGPNALHLAYQVVAGGLTVSYLVAVLQIHLDGDGDDYDDAEAETIAS